MSAENNFSYFLTSGCGVLLIENINNSFHFILVHNKSKNTYDIPGGRIDDNSDIRTAINELFEESLGLFKIKSNFLKNYNKFFYINSPKNKYKLYKIYVIYLNKESDLSYYNKNLAIIKKFSKVKSCYKETNKITRMKFNDFLNNNYKINIRSRDIDILNSFFKLKWINIEKNKLDLPKIELKLVNKNYKEKFLKNINSYIIG